MAEFQHMLEGDKYVTCSCLQEEDEIILQTNC